MEEDIRTEFKRQLTKDCMKSVVAFSNTVGGTIYIGIDDDGTSIGVDDVDSVSLKAIQLISDTIRPDLRLISSIDHICLDGKDIVAISINEGTSKPYYLREKGMRPEGVYIRIGPSSVQASDAQILKMVRESSKSFESLRSFEQDLTFETAEEVFKSVNVEFGKKQMVSLGMLADGYYTNLAFLLSDQCSAGMKIAAFSDRDRTGFLGRTEVRGSILTQVREAMDFLEKYNPLRSRIVGLRRIDYKAYPEYALREALTNAVVHRDYSLDSDTLVSVFGDGMAISSYGGLRKGLGMDDLVMGVSSPRNPKLASIFYRLGFIEAYGTGIPRMMGEYSNAFEKPWIELSTNVFKVELPVFSPEVAEQPAVDAILNFARSCDVFSRSDIEGILGGSRSRAGSILSAMVEEGLLEKLGEGKATRYRVPKKRADSTTVAFGSKR